MDKRERRAPLISGTFAWPRKIMFSPDALGSTQPVSFNSIEAEFSLPTLPSVEEAFELLAPPGEYPAAENTNWGTVLIRPTGISIVKTVGLTIHAPNGSVPTESEISNIRMRFANGLDPWMHRLRAWLAAIMQANLAIEPSSDVPAEIPAGLHLYSMTGERPSHLPTPPRPAMWSMIEPSGEVWNLETSPIPLTAWTRAIRLANQDAPPLEHELLNSARAALARRATRIAVIDACTAAEVALAKALSAKPSDKNEEAVIDELLKQPMNRLHGLAKRFSIECPANIEPLLKPRNDAAHRGKEPSQPDAQSALAIAMEIVNSHSKLPP